MSNYATKSNFKWVPSINALKFAKKAHLADSKLDIDRLDIEKLHTAPVDLGKLSNVIEKVFINALYDKLVKKVNAIPTADTSGWVKKAMT